MTMATVTHSPQSRGREKKTEEKERKKTFTWWTKWQYRSMDPVPCLLRNWLRKPKQKSTKNDPAASYDVPLFSIRYRKTLMRKYAANRMIITVVSWRVAMIFRGKWRDETENTCVALSQGRYAFCLVIIRWLGERTIELRTHTHKFAEIWVEKCRSHVEVIVRHEVHPSLAHSIGGSVYVGQQPLDKFHFISRIFRAGFDAFRRVFVIGSMPESDSGSWPRVLFSVPFVRCGFLLEWNSTVHWTQVKIQLNVEASSTIFMRPADRRCPMAALWRRKKTQRARIGQQGTSHRFSNEEKTVVGAAQLLTGSYTARRCQWAMIKVRELWYRFEWSTMPINICHSAKQHFDYASRIDNVISGRDLTRFSSQQPSFLFTSFFHRFSFSIFPNAHIQTEWKREIEGKRVKWR